MNQNPKRYCLNCSFQSDLRDEINKHMENNVHHCLSDDQELANQYPITGIAQEQVLARLEELIEFLKFDSIGGIWNSINLVEMLEDLFKEKTKTPYKVDETKPWVIRSEVQ